ncbi:endonuclease/exonuclease/phosphatase family protein [Prolixibacteraceae bacterium JC049]|nr:endonuclease/exonuclease/phosphatase family protein [Prolixibacteraceae bacterium JC049]
MKHIQLLLIGLITISWLSCSRQQKKDTTKVKVMVWNILHGGKNKSLPKDGRPDVISIIKESKADVVMMIETYGASDTIAAALNYHHQLISSNLCIYSKYPITKKLVFPDSISTFNFGGVQLDVNGKPLLVFDTWLHYLPDTRLVPLEKTEAEILAWENAGTRDNEVRTIINTIQSYTENADSIPVLIGGDLNSHSHLDWTTATKGMYNHGNAVVNWTVSKTLTTAGYTDSFREAHPDPTKNIGSTWLAVTKNGVEEFSRKDRIDYLYYKGKKLTNISSESYAAPFNQPCKYGTKTYSNFPSDHGFVITTFELE